LSDPSKLEAVMRNHERTQHHFVPFAPGPAQLDWANQADRFRRFQGAALGGACRDRYVPLHSGGGRLTGGVSQWH
jgi:hypothetical protein